MNPPEERGENALRTVLIYRDRLLPWSQTFIAAQAGSMLRNRAVFVGTRTLGSGSIEVAPSITLSQGVLRGYVAEAGLKSLGLVSGEWLERMRSFRPALVHAHFGPDGLFALPIAQRLRVPLVVTFHGYDITMHAGSSVPFWLYTRFRPRLFRRAECIIAVSDFVARELVANGCPPEKVRRHYIGVDMNRFRALPDAQREPIVLFVGRLVENKGCRHLLSAMAMVQAWRRDIQLVIVGDGPERARLEHQASNLGLSVRFLGALPSSDVEQWMRRASVFCVPSVRATKGDREAFGIVFIEAQALGLPVVSTSHGGIPEAVSHERTGILVPEKDEDSLAVGIRRLFEDRELWQRLSNAGPRHVASNFDLLKQTEALENIYDEIIARTD